MIFSSHLDDRVSLSFDSSHWSDERKTRSSEVGTSRLSPIYIIVDNLVVMNIIFSDEQYELFTLN